MHFRHNASGGCYHIMCTCSELVWQVFVFSWGKINLLPVSVRDEKYYPILLNSHIHCLSSEVILITFSETKHGDKILQTDRVWENICMVTISLVKKASWVWQTSFWLKAKPVSGTLPGHVCPSQLHITGSLPSPSPCCLSSPISQQLQSLQQQAGLLLDSEVWELPLDVGREAR